MTAGVKDMLDNIGIHNVTSRTEQPREHSPLATADTSELGDDSRLLIRRRGSHRRRLQAQQRRFDPEGHRCQHRERPVLRWTGVMR